MCLWSRLNIGITDLTAHGPKWGMTQLSECGNLTTALKFLSQVLGSTVSQIPQFWLFNLEIVCNTPQFGNEILQQPNRGMRKNVMMDDDGDCDCVCGTDVDDEVVDDDGDDDDHGNNDGKFDDDVRLGKVR